MPQKSKTFNIKQKYAYSWSLKKRNRTFALRLCLLSSFGGNESIFSGFYGIALIILLRFLIYYIIWFCSIVQCCTASMLYCIVIAVISCSRNGGESYCPTELVMQPKLNLHLGCNVVSWIGNVITCNVEYPTKKRRRKKLYTWLCYILVKIKLHASLCTAFTLAHNLDRDCSLLLHWTALHCNDLNW